MHARTALLLALVVGALGGLAWWQVGREESGAFESERPFLEGTVSGRIVRMHVDNLERGLQLTLERDEAGRWWIVDPIEFPAEVAVIDLVLEALDQSAFDVTDPDLGGLSLDPPRVVLKIDEEIDGGRRARRIELGAVDLDHQHMFARVDGEVLRVLRTLDSALERDLPGWRSRSLFHDLSPRAVVELSRRGSAKLLDDEDPLAVDLRAAVGDDGWRATEPWDVRLDPARSGRLLQSICWLRAASFVDDSPRDLAFYGLDPAPVTFELETADGRREVLRLAPPSGGEEWLAAVESSPHVYSISYEDMVLLSTPLDLLVDRAVARFARDRVGRVELEGAGRSLRLERDGAGWLLSAEGSGLALSRVRADATRVGDVLSSLERARLQALLPDVPWTPRPEPTAIRIELDGRVLGGELGAAHRTPDGGEGVLFRRAGDGLVSLVGNELYEMVTQAPDSLRSRELVDVQEIDVVRIELAAGDQRRVYVRQASGRWSRERSEVEATSFSVLVDRLLSLRALEHLPGGVVEAAGQPVVVRVVRGRGDPVVYELGTRGEGEGLFTSEEGQARVDSRLHADLLELLGG